LVGDRRAAANELGIVIRDLFHPLLMIDGTEGKTAKVRVRAGEFPPGDPSAEQLSSGAFFQPIFRYYNKQRELQQIQQVPWTYLSVDSTDRGQGLCSVHSGLRVTLGRNSKRMESWAIGVRPTFAETRIRLTPHNNPTKPLTGYQVNVYERRLVMPAPEATAPEIAKTDATQPADAAKPADGKPAAETKPVEPPQPVPQFEKILELVTDRRGRVTVPAAPERPLIWLYVSSGGNMLGRFPYIPGIAPATTAELPDDTLRLQLESRLELLRAELIDTVARRALLIARAKGTVRADDGTRFDETLKELDRQPNAKQFHTLLDAIKVSTAKQALERKDRNLERRLDKLCKESAELIERHLSDEKLKEQRDDLVELRKLEQDTTTDNAKPRAAVPTRSPASR
ncbi:MAG TPA: hypothetical protein VK137_06245, partial [Planctomycetaceae bacterium]|nr:hypothetical protein [Planctomycetaceae bacterium]